MILHLPVLTQTVGVAPGTTTMQLGAAQDNIYMDPYSDDVRLRGLGDDTTATADAPRWGLALFAGFVVFASVVGFNFVRSKR